MQQTFRRRKNCTCSWKGARGQGGVLQNIRSNNLQAAPPNVPLRCHHPARHHRKVLKIEQLFWQQHSNRYRYIDCHISEFPTFRGSLSSENSSRPATSAQFSPTIHCDINSESEDPNALHMAPTSSPKITYSSRPSWKGCPTCPFHKSKVQRSAHHSRPSLSNASSSNGGPRYQNGSMEKHGPVGQRMNHLVSGGIPCCARNSQLLPFNMLLPLLAPWPPFFTPASLLNHRLYKNLPNSSNQQITSNSYGLQLHLVFSLNHHLPKCFFLFLKKSHLCQQSELRVEALQVLRLEKMAERRIQDGQGPTPRRQPVRLWHVEEIKIATFLEKSGKVCM